MVWWEGYKEIERFEVDIENVKPGKRRGLYTWSFSA
jgi:hypothetical protein